MHRNRARELCQRNISRFRAPAQTTTHPHKIKSEIAKVGLDFNSIKLEKKRREENGKILF
jgi:hypothetical protein